MMHSTDGDVGEDEDEDEGKGKGKGKGEVDLLPIVTLLVYLQPKYIYNS